MIHIAVIDDDKAFREDMRTRISAMDESFDVTLFSETDDFISCADSFQILIMDILLGTLNGISTAAEIIRCYPSLKLVFVSSERDFFQDVYSVSHTYFMIKPVSDEDLKRAFELCLNKPDDNIIYLRQGSGTTAVDLNQTSYFEGMLRKTIVHYSDGTDITVNIPLKEVEGYINSIDFVRTHQSYIVNLAHVTRALKTKLVIADIDIPISRKYMASTADTVSRYIGRKMM